MLNFQTEIKIEPTGCFDVEFNAVIYTYLPASLQARDMNFVGVHLGGWQFRESTRVHARVYGHACVRLLDEQIFVLQVD